MAAPRIKPKRRKRGYLFRFLLDPIVFVLIWLWYTLTWPLWALQFAAFRLLDVFRHWWSSRNFWLLLPGIPAIVVMLGCTYVIGAISLQDHRQLVNRYHQAAKSAMDAGQYEAAKVYLDRVLEFQGGDREAMFDMAKAAANTNDAPRAASAMLVLAPEDHSVYGPAHLWQAIRILSHKPLTIKDVRVAETHLVYALDLNENTPVAHQILGDLYFQRGLWVQAIPHLTFASQAHPEYMVRVAVAYKRMGEKDKVRRWGELARDNIAKRALARPQDVQLKLDLAEAYAFLEQFSDAVQTLRDALVLHDDPSIHSGLAMVYIAWSDSLVGNSQEIQQQKFSLLAAGIQASPDELTLFQRVMILVEADPGETETVTSFLNANLLEGRAIGLSHLILGSLDFDRGNQAEAILHLERAYDSLPNAEIVANNLAWLLIHSSPPQAERALKIVNTCVERFPKVERFRDTRGHALLKLKRYREAIDDLEAALQALRTSPRTHRALSEAYAELGLSKLATQHLERAKTLETEEMKESGGRNGK